MSWLVKVRSQISKLKISGSNQCIFVIFLKNINQKMYNFPENLLKCTKTGNILDVMCCVTFYFSFFSIRIPRNYNKKVLYVKDFVTLKI